MFQAFYPKEYVDSTYEIDFEGLYRRGYRGILFDVDNTLVPHGAPATAQSVELFQRLHEMGFAHSVECWDEEGLQGGLYGVALGKAFFGESMFHRKTDASKIALVALVQYLRAHRFLFLDTQWTTPHLLKFGTYEVPAREYRKLLKRALEEQ